MTAPTPGPVLRFFSHPAVGITGTLASVLGVALAVWFYVADQRTRELTALVNPVRTTVVKTGQASKLSVSVEGHVVSTDVTSLQIAVWNRGKLSIRSADLLKPVEIVMPGSQILEASIRQQTRDVVNFRIDTTRLTNGRVPLSWDILEQNDGAVIQLIYAGSDAAPVSVEGVIEGQPSICHVDPDPAKWTLWRSLLFAISVLSTMILAATVILEMARTFKSNTHIYILSVRMRLLMLIVLAILAVTSVAQLQPWRIVGPLDF